MDGEAIKDIFYLIPTIPVVLNPTLDLPSVRDGCCSDCILNVLADSASTDPFKNDANGFIQGFPEIVDSVTVWLYKNGNIQAELSGTDALGTRYPFGFYVDSKLNNYIGYQLEWKKVIDLFGVDKYQVKFEYTSPLGNGTIVSPEFNLQQYTPERANKTVRIEYFLNGIIGNNSDDTQYRDFGTLDWYNSLRIPAFFGLPGSPYEDEFVQYSNGQRQWVKNEQEPEYILKTKLLPAFIHDLMRTDILQADTILITDYNSLNANKYIQKAVRRNSEYRPVWRQNNKLAEVEVKFIQEYNNLKRRRC